MHRSSSRWRWAASMLLITACSSTSEPPAPPPEAPSEAPVAVAETPTDDPEEREALRQWLEGCQLPLEDFTRGKVYTWTRAEQIEALRAPRARLLSRSRGTTGATSGFDRALRGDEHPIAYLLRTRRTTRRFAWISPWPTRMGWEEGDYGDRLIAIRLREGAWVARFQPELEGDARWEVRDGEGEAVSAAQVVREPERVGFVVHIGSGLGPGDVTRQFREVVVVNEDQIQSWSVGTEAIQRQLTRDAEHLERLADYWETYPEELPEDDTQLGAAARTQWRSPEPGTELLDLYLGCLALPGTEYVPTPEALRQIAETLRASPEEAPLTREPVQRPRPRRPIPPPQPQYPIHPVW